MFVTLTANTVVSSVTLTPFVASTLEVGMPQYILAGVRPTIAAAVNE